MTSVIESIESLSKETSDTSASKSKKREYKFHSRRNRENVNKEYSTPKKEIQEEQKQIEENSIENLLIKGKFKPKEIIEEMKKNEESINKDDDIIEEEVEVTIKEEKKTFKNKNSRRKERLKSKEKVKELKESKDEIIEEFKTKEESEKKAEESEKKKIEKKTIKEIKYITTTSKIINIIKPLPTSSKEFITEFHNEINNLRANPKKYNNELQYYEDNAKLSYGFKPNIQKDILKLINKIRNSNNTQRLQKNDKLNEIAEQYLQELRFSKGSKFYPKDQEVLLNDLNSEFNNVKFCKNYVCTNPDPKKGIFDLLFNEKDLLNGTSDRFLNQEAKFIGIAHDKIRNLQVTIIIVSDTNIQIQKEKLFDGLLNELNKARNNPQMYLKFISQNHENYEKILYAKKVCSLEYNYLIEKACEERGKKFDEENTFYNRNELNNFLSQYGKNYFIIQEYINDSTSTAKDFVINMFQKENINQILLNRRIKQVGFSQSPNGKIILIFTDCFDRNLEKNEISIGSLRRKLFRPNLTEDEILQIKNDFNLFDSRSEGLIKPNLLLLIANKCNNWGNDNPFYYTALKELNNEENNKKGVSFEQFISTVKRVIRDYSRDDFENNWEEIFNLYFGDGKKNIISKEILSQVIKDLGFKIDDDEINEFVDRMEGELDLSKFIQIMKEVELSNFRK
jgi:hypothetical protein